MKNARTKRLDLVIGGMLALGMAQFLIMILNRDRLSKVLYTYYIQPGILLVVVTLSVVFVIDGYNNTPHRGYLKGMIAVSRQMTITFATGVTYLFAFQLNKLLSRMALPAIFVFGTLSIYGERLLIKRFLERKYQKIKYAQTVTVIAMKQQAEVLIGCSSAEDFSIFHIQGLAVTDRNMRGEGIQGITVNRSMGEMTGYVTGHIVDEVLLSILDDPQQESELANQLLPIRTVVRVYVEQFLQDIPRKTLEKIYDISVMTCYNREIPSRSLFCKRMLNIVESLMGVVMAFGVGLMIRPIIYMKSPGFTPFSRARMGKNDHKFELYKFRSMVMDAGQQEKSLVARNRIRGNMFKIDNDSRIIPDIGRFIRRTSLNELPQFFNVLKGDVSLMGARLSTVDEYESYSFAYKKRPAVEPGITGLQQISGRNNITDSERVVKLDSRCIDQWDLEMNLEIILRTVLVMLK